jgi:hypothetical protein
MITNATFIKLASSFPYAKQEDFKTIKRFKIKGKIFATLNAAQNRATLKLSEIDQDVFCSFDLNIIYAVPNKWGKYGWTHLNLKQIETGLCLDALEMAYNNVSINKPII